MRNKLSPLKCCLPVATENRLTIRSIAVFSSITSGVKLASPQGKKSKQIELMKIHTALATHNGEITLYFIFRDYILYHTMM